MNKEELTIAVNQSILDAEKNLSHVAPHVLQIDGMSGRKMRHFLNNLMAVKLGHRTRYLEVGSWRGSTFCSAISNNDIEATSIENFSEFQSISFVGDNANSNAAFHRNIEETLRLSNAKSTLRIINQDSFAVNTNILGKFDIYFYDGEHSLESQYKAFTYFDSCLEDRCIIIVDDYDNDITHGNSPRESTQKAFKDLNYTVIKDWFLFGGNQPLSVAFNEWWNGVYIAIIEKK